MTKAAGMFHTFKTLDIYLSAFLLLCGLKPDLEVNNGKVVFAFQATDELYRYLAYYNEGVDVKVTEYVTTIKILRGQMLTLRNAK